MLEEGTHVPSASAHPVVCDVAEPFHGGACAAPELPAAAQGAKSAQRPSENGPGTPGVAVALRPSLLKLRDSLRYFYFIVTLRILLLLKSVRRLASFFFFSFFWSGFESAKERSSFLLDSVGRNLFGVSVTEGVAALAPEKKGDEQKR